MAIAFNRQEGNIIDITAGSNGISAGDVYIAGGLKGVANGDIPANEIGAITVVGVYDIVKASAEVISLGGDVWYDTTSKCCYASSASTDCTKLGIAVEAAASGATSVKTRLA